LTIYLFIYPEQSTQKYNGYRLLNRKFLCCHGGIHDRKRVFPL